VDLGLSHSPAPLLSILFPHSPTSDDRHPCVFIHVSYPAFSRSSSHLPAVEFFIQGLFRHARCTRPSQLILLNLTNLTMEFHEMVELVRNVMAHAQKPDLVFQRNGRVHLNRRGFQFSRLVAADACASAVVMLDRPSSDTVQDCWLPIPFAYFPFTFPPVRLRVPSDSERAIQQNIRRDLVARSLIELTTEFALKVLDCSSEETCGYT